MSFPAPIPSPLSRPFWEAARRGELALQRCRDCGRFRWTPQYLCRHCHSQHYDWVATSGRGAVYSYTVVHRAPLPDFQAPYALAVVELEEGPLMLTNILDCPFEELRIGMRVEVALRPLDAEITLYPFRPSRSEQRPATPDSRRAHPLQPHDPRAPAPD